ncbi:MAG: copper homeostasis protein CutC, partial [Lachnospiraceae bacterium]|nr:copper homeostasis protein CutC [Lachnospiraceae bacterium]
MKDYILECCVDSVESAICAANGGASRLELCSNLPIGGTSPDIALVHQIRKETDIRIHALIRPRFGDFCYSSYEMEIMKEQIRMLKQERVEGVVIGVLDADGNLNLSAMKDLIVEAEGMSI